MLTITWLDSTLFQFLESSGHNPGAHARAAGHLLLIPASPAGLWTPVQSWGIPFYDFKPASWQKGFWESITMGSISAGRNPIVKSSCLSAFKGPHPRFNGLYRRTGHSPQQWRLCGCAAAPTQGCLPRGSAGASHTSCWCLSRSPSCPLTSVDGGTGNPLNRGELSWETLHPLNFLWPQQLWADVPDTRGQGQRKGLLEKMLRFLQGPARSPGGLWGTVRVWDWGSDTPGQYSVAWFSSPTEITVVRGGGAPWGSLASPTKLHE